MKLFCAMYNEHCLQLNYGSTGNIVTANKNSYAFELHMLITKSTINKCCDVLIFEYI